ncbi:MAG: bifunctional (p)ppGpp synthetase/guanosine-3',5'-bis(diphosphate) 3'-pyrophosphohydrolase [Fimbriimonadales bacterium]|nr:bifunctional (p)ppGpp synthetase/guanosine-3',5'-bis(diphosphate) 3'-pyrophosphohydrolase [Fimbriimonadales bacterium]
MYALEFELPELVDTLIEKVRDYAPEADTSRIVEAYLFAEERHHGQKRKSGEPYITHPLAVALILADLQMGVNTVIAGLLHDVLEDTPTTPEELEQRFGATVRKLVEGVSKLHHSERKMEIFNEASRRRLSIAKTAENLRKLLLAVADDLRVMIIKLADRLHNMQTLDAMPPEKQIQIAAETMQVYAPLAHRLGIYQIKAQLDDLAFKYLYPQEYREISQKVAQTRAQRQKEVQELITILKDRLWERGVRAEVMGRPKHLWSIFNKMKQQQIDFSQIYDLIALRVLTETVEECYMALGIVHELWRPIPALFYDYIAAPKPNGYQSLHTKVIGPNERTLEIQIRTWHMHQVAEYGVAAHWRYKEGQDQKPIQIPSLQQQLRELTDARSNLEFLTSVFRDMTADQVFVFTPRGDIIDLPEGSTPIDFAYRIHTEVGNRCVGARVNGRIVPLDYRLRTGDIVEIITRQNAQPSYDWMNLVRTSSARSKIRAYFREARRTEFVEHGRTLLDRELARLRIPLSQFREALPEVLKSLNLRSENDLYASIGEGLTTVQAVTQRLRALQPATPSELPSSSQASALAGREIRAMQIEDADGYMTRRATCCYPLPGDELRGYISRGRGIVVHRASCSNLRALEDKEPERVMNIEWVPQKDRGYPVALRFETLDRPGVLADITTILGSSNINIADVRVRRNPKDSTAVIDIVIQASSAQELRAITQKLASLEDVLAVSRLMEGIGKDASRHSKS